MAAAVKDERYLNLVFTALGITTLYSLNALFNSISTIVEVKFGDDQTLSAFFIALFQTGTFVGSFGTMLSRGGGINPLILATSCIGQVVSLALFISVPVIPDNYAAPVFECALLMMGFTTGCSQTSGMALASNCLGENRAKPFFSGQGWAGVLSFVLWLTIFTIGHTGRVFACLAVLWGVGIAVAIFVCISTWQLQHTKEQHRYILSILSNEPNAPPDSNSSQTEILSHQNYKIVNEDPVEVKSSRRKILAECKLHLSLIFVNFFTTLLIFPGLGPLSWRQSAFHTLILVGSFQITDLAGRTLVASMLPLRTSAALIWATLLRTAIFVPLFAMCAAISNHAVLTSFFFQLLLMVCMGLSNGWAGSGLFVALPECVASPDKSSAGALGCPVVLTGVLAGSWLASFLVPMLASA